MNIEKPHVEIIDLPEGDFEDNMLKIIELTGRVCYGSQDKIEPGSGEPFVNMLVNSGHWAPLEHGTVYMTMSLKTEYDWEVLRFYRENPYSIVRENPDGCEFYVSTNYRVIVENERWEDYDNFRHAFRDNGNFERRVTVLFNLPVGIAREFDRHRTHSICEESTRFCIAGDMLIVVNGETVKVRELYRRFTEKIGAGPFTTDTFNLENKEIERCEIARVSESGIQTCLSLTTDCGEILTITPSHQVMNSGGDFVEASTLKAGDSLWSDMHHMVTVVSVNEIKDVDTYEIEMGCNANFFIGGMCVHNCNYSGDKYNSSISVSESYMFRKTPDSRYSELSRRINQAQLFKSLCNDISLYGEDVCRSWEAADYWFLGMLASEFAYMGLTQKCGWTPQAARDTLGLGIRTRSYHTAFVDEWKHFFNMRAFASKGNKPHPQAIELAAPLMEEFISRGYIVREDLKPGLEKEDK